MLFPVISKQKLLCHLLKLSLSLSILLGYTRFLMEIMFVLLNLSVLNVAKLIFSLFALVDIVILFFVYIFLSWARLGVLVLRGRVFGCKYLVGDLVSYCI